MHVSLIWSSSEIRRQMIFHINYLSHVFHLMAHSFTLMTVASTTWSEWPDAISQILILRCWAMSFQSIEIKLIFIWCSTNGSFIHLMRNHTALIGLLIIYDLGWISCLVVLTSDIHRMRLSSCMCRLIWVLRRSISWLAYLSVVTTSLRSTLNLVLDLRSLFFIWLSDRNTLADLLLLWSIKWMHLVMRSHHKSASWFGRRDLVQLLSVLGRIHVDFWVVNTVTRISFRRRWSVSSLCGCDSSGSWRLSFWWVISWWWVSLVLLLLQHHLLFYLLLVQLLRWRQIKIVNDVRNICNSIGSYLTVWTCLRRILSLGIIRIDLHIVWILILTLKSILDNLSRFIVTALTVTLESFVRLSFLSAIFKVLVIQYLILVTKVNQLLLFLHLNIFRRQMLTSMILNMVCS